MPRKNAIVATIEGIEPSVDRPPAEMGAEAGEGFSIRLEGDQTARLPAGARAAGMLAVLESLRQIDAPVYIELEPDTDRISRLLVPTRATVKAIEDRGEEVEVELEISHARHVLRRSNPDFEELLATLQKAREEKGWVVVTGEEDHEIIDVRLSTKAPPDIEIGPPPKRPWYKCLFLWFWCLWRCMSKKRAKDLFDQLAATTCNPLTVPPPCIPFMYPDDGCWGRAHEMCRLLIAAGAKPRKVWIYHSPGNWLQASTRNHPNCYVQWSWHVAPTLCVRTGFLSKTEMVIDPSLFTGPVTKPTWKGAQGDPGASLVDTSCSVFYRSSGGSTTTDPTYTQTNQVLATYRAALLNRSLSAVGPPPYANCP